MEAYLDNAATTRVLDSVVEVMEKVMRKDYGNPSSLHQKGVDAEWYMRDFCETFARILKVDPSEIYFTSGGTESNNTAIIGSAMANSRMGKKIITTSIEHPSVHAPMRYLGDMGFDVAYLPVDKNGIVDMDALKDEMSEDTILVSVMMVNNEVGSLQPIEEIGKYIKTINPGVVYHVDAVQALGKMEIRPKKAMIDLMSCSGHKIGGPKGSGLLYMKKNTKMNPYILGGGQQKGVRSGTENVPAAAGMAQAARQCYENLDENVSHMISLKDALSESLAAMEGVRLFSSVGKDGAPHIVSASIDHIRGEVMVHALEEYGIYISSGSACSSNKPKKASPTLSAMGVGADMADTVARFSFCPYNTMEEVDYTVKTLKEIVPKLRKYVRY